MPDPKFQEPYPDHADPYVSSDAELEDPLVELARIVSEGSGLETPQAAVPEETVIALPEDHVPEAVSPQPAAADLEAELLSGLQQSLEGQGHSGDQPAADIRADGAYAGAPDMHAVRAYETHDPQILADAASFDPASDTFVDPATEMEAQAAEPAIVYEDPAMAAGGYAGHHYQADEYGTVAANAAEPTPLVEEYTYDEQAGYAADSAYDETAYEEAAHDESGYSHSGYAEPEGHETDYFEPTVYSGAESDIAGDLYADVDPTVSDPDGIDVLPPHSPEELAAAPQQSNKRGMAVAVGVITLAILGGGGFIGYRVLSDGIGSGPPILVKAEPGSFKIKPEESETASAGSKLIYDRVGEGEDPATGTLIDRTEKPIRTVVSRVVKPEADAGTVPTDSATRDDPATASDVNSGPLPMRSRKVRTVVIRPDGTIISDGGGTQPTISRTASAEPVAAEPTAGAQPVGSGPAAKAEDTMTAPAVDQPRTVSTQPIKVGEPAGSDTAASDTTAAISSDTMADNEPEVEVQVATASTPKPRAAPRGSASSAVSTNQSDNPGSDDTASRPAAAPKPARKAQPKPTRTASRSTGNQPMSLLPNDNQPTGQSNTSSGGWVVQVSSQRSRSAAQTAYRSLQRRYPSLLSNRAATIQTANLGDRGTYYRVGVGPMGQGEAGQLCRSLKSSGADCFIRRR